MTGRQRVDEPWGSSLDQLVDALEQLEAGADGPEAGLEHAAVLERTARSLGREDLARSAAVLALDLRVRREGVGDALGQAQRQLSWAQRHGASRLASRCHALLAMVHVVAGNPGTGAEHATQAVALLTGDEWPRVRARLLTRQAVGLFVAGLLERGVEVTRKALRIADDLDDHDLTVQLASNAVQFAVLSGRPIEARQWVRVLEGAVAHRPDLRWAAAQPLAQGYLVDDRPADALALLTEADESPERQLEADQPATHHLLLAVALRRLGQLDQAGRELRQADDLARAGELREVALAIQQERAELAAATGDHRLAYELHRRFHRQELARVLEATSGRAAELFAQQSLDEALHRATRAEQAATRDALTGVRNRQWLQQELPRQLREWHRAGSPVALALLDIDRFKSVNDTWGHDMGDQVLRDLTRCLSDAPGVVEVARLGGDEILLVLLGDPGRWQEDAEGALAAIRSLAWLRGRRRLTVSASIGLARHDPGVAGAISRTLREADLRLYRAKAGGRDRAVGPWTSEGEQAAHELVGAADGDGPAPTVAAEWALGRGG